MRFWGIFVWFYLKWVPSDVYIRRVILTKYGLKWYIYTIFQDNSVDPPNVDKKKELYHTRFLLL